RLAEQRRDFRLKIFDQLAVAVNIAFEVSVDLLQGVLQHLHIAIAVAAYLMKRLVIGIKKRDVMVQLRFPLPLCTRTALIVGFTSALVKSASYRSTKPAQQSFDLPRSELEFRAEATADNDKQDRSFCPWQHSNNRDALENTPR